MKVSHEVPIWLFEKSLRFNDYDYCLVHLLEKSPEYKEFYFNSKKIGRKVLLDNSAYELGSSYDPLKYVKVIEKLEPYEYVIPDIPDDSYQSVEVLKRWVKTYKNLPGRKIGVVHGDTVEEFVKNYRIVADKVDKIAISFGEPFYYNYDSLDGCSRTIRASYGRVELFKHLKEKKIISEKPHHLLGCTVAGEFRHKIYREVNIESLDTSNPIVCGYFGIKYNTVYGSNVKPGIKLCDLLNNIPSLSDKEIIFNNINIFRKFVNE